MNDFTPNKTCSKCKKKQPATIEYFHRDKNRKGGLFPQCKTCCKEYRDTHKEQRSASFKDWRLRNRDSEIVRVRQWRIDNPDYHHQWYLDHAEQERVRGQKWRENHPDRVKERGKRYRDKYPHRVKIWCLIYPEKIRTVSERRRSRKRSLPNTLTHKEWQSTLEHFNGCCAVCGRPPGLWHTIAMDHWIPLSADIPENPGTVAYNVIPLCHGVGGCNNEKRSSLPRVWLQKKLGKGKGKRVANEIETYLEGLRVGKSNG